jgi:hypothetical protein
MSRLLDTVTFGTARRQRRMARLLAQLDRVPIDALPTGPQSRSSFRPPKRRGLPGLRAVATLMVWVLIIGGVVYLARLGHKSSGASSPAQHQLDAGSGALGVSSSATSPTPKVGEHKQRLLPAPSIPAGSGGYTFMATNGKQPVTYDPCRPIHYVIREHNAPAGGDDEVRQALSVVSKATGLQFIDDGASDEPPSETRASYQPTRYGDRWAPVLIAWTDPTEIPALAGDTSGEAVSQRYGSTSGAPNAAYVSGLVFLDAPQLTQMASTGGTAALRPTIEHELGHLMGLDHVTDRAQLMYPTTGRATSYGAGDLRGLAQEGRGSCHPEL